MKNWDVTGVVQEDVQVVRAVVMGHVQVDAPDVQIHVKEDV